MFSVLIYLSVCIGDNRSQTTLTGVNVVMGTSTKTVFQCAIAPFHSPGRSIARSARPPYDLSEINPVFGSTYFVKSNLFPCASRTPHTKSTGLKCDDVFIIPRASGAIWLDSTICNDSVPSSPCTQNGPPPGAPIFLTTPHTRTGRFRIARSASASALGRRARTNRF